MAGTIHGNVQWYPLPSPREYGLTFPGGSGSYIDFGNISAFRGGAGLTVFISFLFDYAYLRGQSSRALMFKGYDEPNSTSNTYEDSEILIEMISNDGVGCFRMLIGGTDYKTGRKGFIGKTSSTFVIGENWMTFAATYSRNGRPSGIKLYRNGIALSTADATGSFKRISSHTINDAPVFLFGDDSTEVNRGFVMTVDLACFWTKPLTVANIRKINNDPLSLLALSSLSYPVNIDTSLAAEFVFSERQGNTTVSRV